MRIAEDLDLDVARLRDVAFEIDTRIGEARLSSIGAALERALDLRLFVNDLHANAAATADRFDDDGITDFARDPLGVRDSFRSVDRDRLVGSGNRSGIGFERHVTRLHLVAKGIEDIGGRSDERRAGIGDRACECGFLAQEAVARMDRVRARVAQRFQDRVDIEIRLFRRRRPDEDLLVRFGDVRRVRVRVRINRDGRDAETFAGANDAASDLTAICDQDLAEHRSQLQRCSGALKPPRQTSDMRGVLFRSLGNHRTHGARADAIVAVTVVAATTLDPGMCEEKQRRLNRARDDRENERAADDDDRKRLLRL